ncbi:hypothetical protein F2Q68_00011454 [Brassica cretica]|uniref:Uncharacterized protein n=1 Tax=Brassica cretica TaxID=69181 RepID=A0A8S9L125_BRACR|nr:hypothetical protein F2Q68_00011454 [Brassica cretica]
MMHAMCAACVFVLTHELLQQAEPTVMALQKLKLFRLTSLHLISQFVDQDVFSLLLISVQLQGAITFICLGRLIIISDSASSGSSKELAFLFRKKTTKGRGQKQKNLLLRKMYKGMLLVGIAEKVNLWNSK